MLLSSHVVFPAHIFKHMPLLCVYPLQELTLISPRRSTFFLITQQQPWKIDSHFFLEMVGAPDCKGGETKISFFPPHSLTHSSPFFDKEIWTTDRHTRKGLLRTREMNDVVSFCSFGFSFLLFFLPFVSASGGGLKKMMISQDGRGGGRRGGMGEATTRKSAGVSSNKWCATQMDEHPI